MNKYKRLFLALTISIIVTCVYACEDKESDVKVLNSLDASMNESTTSMKSDNICVYIVGEVVNPGVYELEYDSRVCDVVDMAGGFTQEAATEYINLARKVSDGEKIIIYSIEQVQNNQVGIDTSSSLVNINTAGVTELMTLPGIGESRANDIIKYREKNGRFDTIEDIMKVSGIKEAAFSKIEDLITVN